MSDLEWEPEAAATYLAIPESNFPLIAAVNDVLDLLQQQPRSEYLRQTLLRTPKGHSLWRVSIRRSHENWSLVWCEHPTRKNDVLVVYLGPSTY